MYCPKHQIRKICLSCHNEEQARKAGSIRTPKKVASSRRNILRIHKNRKPFELKERDVQLLKKNIKDKRAQAMLVLLETDSPSAASRAVGVTKTTIYNWKKIISELGAPGLLNMTTRRHAHRRKK